MGSGPHPADIRRVQLERLFEATVAGVPIAVWAFMVLVIAASLAFTLRVIARPPRRAVSRRNARAR